MADVNKHIISMDDSDHTTNAPNPHDLTVNWNMVISNRRKRTNSETSSVRPSKLNNTQLSQHTGISTSNRFTPLENNDVQTEVNSSKVPPIFLKTEVNYIDFLNLLTKLVGDQMFKCSSTIKGIKIHPLSPETYRKIVHFLRDNNAEFHTYQLPEDKVFRVVIRGLHHSVDPDIIKAELALKGFNVRNVTNVWSRDKIRLPLFFIDLDNSKENDNIFDLQTLFHSKIKVEEPRPKRQIVQCMRCQQFGHTKKYCNLKPKCVRCAGNHESSTCIKPKDTPATCALCGDHHPANYRGCSVHRMLQNRRSTLTGNKQNITPASTSPPFF